MKSIVTALWREWQRRKHGGFVRSHRCDRNSCTLMEHQGVFLCMESGNVHCCSMHCEYAIQEADGRHCALSLAMLPKRMIVAADRLITDFKVNPVAADVSAQTEPEPTTEHNLRVFLNQVTMPPPSPPQEVVLPTAAQTTRKRKAASWTNDPVQFELPKQLTGVAKTEVLRLAQRVWPFMMQHSPTELVQVICSFLPRGLSLDDEVLLHSASFPVQELPSAQAISHTLKVITLCLN